MLDLQCKQTITGTLDAHKGKSFDSYAAADMVIMKILVLFLIVMPNSTLFERRTNDVRETKIYCNTICVGGLYLYSIK